MAYYLSILSFAISLLSTVAHADNRTAIAALRNESQHIDGELIILRSTLPDLVAAERKALVTTNALGIAMNKSPGLEVERAKRDVAFRKLTQSTLDRNNAVRVYAADQYTECLSEMRAKAATLPDLADAVKKADVAAEELQKANREFRERADVKALYKKQADIKEKIRELLIITHR
jgi:hypothetical protein